MSNNIVIEKWKSVELNDAISNLKSNNFSNENHFCDVLEYNIQLICKNIFDDTYVSHEREFMFPRKRGSSPMVDFWIKTINQSIFIECKDSRSRACRTEEPIGQMMKYILLSETYNLGVNRFVILTTDYNIYASAIIKRFNLPIEFYFVTKNTVYTNYN